MLESNSSVINKIVSALESSTFVYIDAMPDARFKKCLNHPDVSKALAKHRSNLRRK